MNIADIFQGMLQPLSTASGGRTDGASKSAPCPRVFEHMFNSDADPEPLQQSVYRGLFEKYFLLRELPQDDLLFFVINSEKKHSTSTLESKIPGPKQQIVVRRRPHHPCDAGTFAGLGESEIHWLHSLALNVICQSEYALKISISNADASARSDTIGSSPGRTMQTWWKQAFASPNKSYFGGSSDMLPTSQNYSPFLRKLEERRESPVETTAAEIR
jgi:hypothetical protein